MWMQNPQENPFFLLYGGRIRRHRKWIWGASLLAAGLLAWLVLELRLGLGPSCAVALLTVCIGQQSAALGCLAQSMYSLGEGGNMEEFASANLSAGSVADSAALFLARRWLWLSPLAVLAALLSGSLTALGLILLLWLFLLPAGCAAVFGSTVQVLFRAGQLPWSAFLGICLRGMLLWGVLVAVALQLIPYGPAAWGSWLLVAVILAQVQQVFESRRLLVGWLSGEARSLVRQSVKPGRKPCLGWMPGVDRNPLLFRYQLSRKQWGGRPLWFHLSLLSGALLGALVLFCRVRGYSPWPLAALGFYAVLGQACMGVFLHIRYLNAESRAGNLELASLSLGRRQLAGHLAELGYLPRLLESGVVVLAGYPFLVLAYPEPALLALPGLAVLSLWLMAQARMSAYINVAWVFALGSRQQLGMLATASFFSQWVALWVPYVLPMLACMPLAGGTHATGPTAPFAFPGVACGLYLISFLGLVWLSRRIALKLA